MNNAQQIQRNLVSAASVLKSARDELASVLYDGDMLYVVERSRTRSKMSATVSVFAVDDDAVVVDVTDAVGRVLKMDRSPNTGYLTVRIGHDDQGGVFASHIANGVADELGIGLDWKWL